MNILFIEDDLTTAEAVKLVFEVFFPGDNLTIAQNGRTGLKKMREEIFQLVILDLGLPDMDGLEVLQNIRTFSQSPILIVSARHEPEIITRTLNEGAQDYILKPFNTPVFIRSIKDLTNLEGSSVAHNGVINITDKFMFTPNTHEARYEGSPVNLDEAEWKTLDYLIKNWGRMVTVGDLDRLISVDKSANGQNIHDIINQLRTKMGDDRYLPKIILAEFDCGYRLVKPHQPIK